MTTRLALLIPLVTVSVLVTTRSGGSEEPKGPESVVMRTAKSKGVTLTAKLKKEAAAGGPYIVTLTLGNESKRRIESFEIGYLMGYEIKILDGERKTVPHTRFGRRRSAFSGRGKSKWLKPGDSSSRIFNLARLFDLSEKGTYHATISRKVHRDRGDGRPLPGGPVIVEITDLPLMLREPTRADHAKWRSAVGNELAAHAAAIDAALSDPERHSEVPGLVAALLVASAQADHADVLQALSKLIQTDTFESPLTSGFAAFVYGALARTAGPLPLAQLKSDSWRFRLLLLGARTTVKMPLDETQLVHWIRAVRGATLHGLKRWDREHPLVLALADNPRARYPNQADYRAWGQVSRTRVLPGFVLAAIRARLSDATEFGTRSRQWVVRSVLRSGLGNPEERRLAYEWLRLESDPETRAELLSGPMRSGGADTAAALQPRLEELVAGGAADAPNALRLLFALDRKRAAALCRERYAQWKPPLRKTAARETLFRQGEVAVAAFARRWEQEKDRAVLEVIFREIDRQGFSRFPGEQAALLRFGDKHNDLLVEFSEVPRTSKLGKRWLAFLARPR